MRSIVRCIRFASAALLISAAASMSIIVAITDRHLVTQPHPAAGAPVESRRDEAASSHGSAECFLIPISPAVTYTSATPTSVITLPSTETTSPITPTITSTPTFSPTPPPTPTPSASQTCVVAPGLARTGVTFFGQYEMLVFTAGAAGTVCVIIAFLVRRRGTGRARG